MSHPSRATARVTTVEVSTVCPTAASREVPEYARRHFRTPITLGVLDADAQFAYTRGQCHALAAAVAERTGWPVVVVEAVTTGRYGRDTFVEHCLVATPDGMWLDVLGEHDPQGWCEARELGPDEKLVIWHTDAAGARALATRAGMGEMESPLLPPNMRAARALVDQVLAAVTTTTAAAA